MNKLEENWKKWKEDRQIDESKYLKKIEASMEGDYERVRRRNWRVSLEEKP